MAYGSGELAAAPIKFPKAKKIKAPKKQRECAYGPRMANGRCPPKPKKARAPRASKAEKAIGQAIGVKVDRQRTSSRTAQNRIADRAADRLASLGQRKITTYLDKNPDVLENFIGGSIFSGSSKMIAARLGTLAAAGIAAYALTTAILNKIKAAKDKKAQERAALADAYRQTRLDVAASKGAALTPLEQRILAEKFKEAAAKIGWKWGE